MAIHCPNCNHGMSVKDVKPGRYKPKCSKCSHRFALTIYAEPDRSPLVELLPADPAGTVVNATSPAPPTETTRKAETVAPTQGTVPAAVSPDATIPAGADPGATLPAMSSEATLAFDPKQTRAAGIRHGATDPQPVARAASTAETLAGPAGPLGKTEAGLGAATVPAMGDRTRVSSSGGPATATKVPDRIGGYKIVKELGRGAMGAVYLARQLSLDREVALKTIQAQWANNPTFIARFTREAYAAAQLTHHNVVQIYDLGADGGTNYFSMEFVRGESLDEMIKRTGPLPPETAVGFILQAARGLQFAHSHGMIHRDVKPANMMLNDLGVVKIADLGLVKVASSSADEDSSPAAGANESSLAAAKSDVTMMNVAMGTPAYMAPEQADNAAGVDHRADIYSLGCSLYVLLTGKPPFEGASAIEVMTKHRTAPVVRPDVVLGNIPKALGDITLKMVAKQPDQRYQNLADVIRDLENTRSDGVAGKVAPNEAQAAIIDQQAKLFHQAPLARMRGVIALGFLGVCLLLALVLLLVNWAMAGALVGLSASAIVAYFVISGLSVRSPLFDRTRAVVFSARWSDWLTWIGGGIVFLAALWLVGWLWIWIFACAVGAALGIAYSIVVDRRLAEQRRTQVDQVESLLRDWRVKGVDEASLQHFVALHSGSHWEEFYETVYGYEAKLAMRQQLAESAGAANRHRFRGWRDPLIRWLDGRLIADREERNRQHLKTLEEKNLRSQGLDARQARQQAAHLADAIVDDAAKVRAPGAQPAAQVVDPAAAAAAKREKIKRMLADAKSGARPTKRFSLAGTALAPVAWALGGKVRFLLGCLLVAGCALWAKQNNLVSGESLKTAAQGVSTNIQSSDVKNLTQTIKLQKGEPLRVPVVGRFFDSWYPGIAGVMLMGLGLMRGWKMSLFALPAAALIVVGPSFGPPVVMLVAGVVLGAVGLFLGRASD